MLLYILRERRSTLLTQKDNNSSNQQTDVRVHGDNKQENVSRETSTSSDKKHLFGATKRAIEKKQRDELKRQTALQGIRKKGGITADNPYDFDNPSFSELYRDFRRNKLSVVESCYNALYLWCSDNYYSSGVPLKSKYKNIYAHPSAWFRNASHMWKHNGWSIAMKALEIIPSITRTSMDADEKRKKSADNLWKALEYSHKSSGKALGFMISFLSFAGIAAIIALWSSSAQKLDAIPALALYIDNNYVGEVLAVSDAEKALDSVEESLSLNYGMSYKLECDISYVPTTIVKGSNLSSAKLSLAFSDAARKHMSAGYGLYAYDVLIAVAPDRTWIDKSIEESLNVRLSEQLRKDDSIEKVSYHNFIIREGHYPDDFFDSHDDIRYLFSLPPLSEVQNSENTTDSKKHDDEISNYLSVSEKTTLLTGGDMAAAGDVAESGQSSAHQISIETVITKTKTLNEAIPFGTEYIYDETMAQNKQIVQSSGKNGSKTAVYLIDYVGDKEISRHLMSEVINSEPINQIVVKGTRELTEEEKRVMSTGKYIFPSKGEHSSSYGWRTFGGYNEFHKGLDIRSNAGLELVASDGGKVIQARNRGDGYGLCILIEHDDGTITRYAHCSKLLVKEGQSVAQGEYIADMGRTGQASGVHIHFEMIKDGVTVNPIDYLEEP